jgi:hypothetical protein
MSGTDFSRDRVLRVAEAVEEMARALNTSESALSHLTCGEADSIIRVLAIGGHRDVAVDLVIGHAVDSDGDSMDDEGDAHWDVAQHYNEETYQWDWEAARQAARAYVDRMVVEA